MLLHDITSQALSAVFSFLYFEKGGVGRLTKINDRCFVEKQKNFWL